MSAVNGRRNGGPTARGAETRAADAAVSGRAELFRALGALAEEPRPEHRRIAELLDLPGVPDAGEFTDLFVLNLYPYASVHLGPEGMLGGEARDRVAGFWQALGILPPVEPDHLGSLLGLLAALVEREAEEGEPAARLLLGRARAALVREHLEPWLPAYLERVRELGGPYYTRWAELLQGALREEALRAADLPADEERAGQVEMPLHLRQVPPLPDPRDTSDQVGGPQGTPAPVNGAPAGTAGSEDGGAAGGPGGTEADAASSGERFLKALLTPVRSGMILTRADLARAGRELRLGTRMGERLYILKALLGQEPGAVLGWLAGEARRQASRGEGWEGFDADVTAFWQDRAADTARLLDELASVEVDMNNGEMDHG